MAFTRSRPPHRSDRNADASRRVRLNDWERLEDRLAPALFVVTSADDTGPGTLRAAITEAELTDDPDLIRFDPSLVNKPINLRVSSSSDFGPTALKISTSITIEGSGQTLARANGAGSLRLFHITPDGDLTLSGLTLRGGYAQGGEGGSGATGGGGGVGAGGAIFNQGKLSIRQSALLENQAIGGGGGNGGTGTSHGNGGTPSDNGSSGIGRDDQTFNTSTDTVSVPFGNGGDFGTVAGFGGGGSGGGNVSFGGGIGTLQAGGGGSGLGGAIFNLGGIINLINTTFAHNSATAGPGGTGIGGGSAGSGSGYGGAIFNLSGSLTVIFSTLAHNSVSLSGNNSGTTGDASGGAIYNAAIPIKGLVSNVASLSLVNSILANSRGGSDLENVAPGNAQTPTDLTAPNLITSIRDATGKMNTAKVIAKDPKLGPLGRHGGDSPSFSISFDSAAYNRGEASVTGFTIPPNDQRNATRDLQPDVGAYEVVHPLAPVGNPLSPGPEADDLSSLQSLYGTILNRPATEDELFSATMALEEGVSWLEIAQQLWESPEHHLLQAEQLLLGVLGTVPTEQSVTNLANQLDAGVSETELLAELLASPEFSDPKNDPTFVKALYALLFGREPTQTELFSEVTKLLTGMTRPELVASLLQSEQSLEHALANPALVSGTNEEVTTEAIVDAIRNGTQTLSTVFVKLWLSSVLLVSEPVNTESEVVEEPIDPDTAVEEVYAVPEERSDERVEDEQPSESNSPFDPEDPAEGMG